MKEQKWTEADFDNVELRSENWDALPEEKKPSFWEEKWISYYPWGWFILGPYALLCIGALFFLNAAMSTPILMSVVLVVLAVIIFLPAFFLEHKNLSYRKNSRKILIIFMGILYAIGVIYVLYFEK